MAPRKKACPNVWSHVSVQLSDREWRQFSVAIDPDLTVADRTKLPGGDTLRSGLQKAIGSVLSSEAGPTTREIGADYRHFVETVVAAYRGMHPETRDLFNESFTGAPNQFIPDLLDATKNAMASIRETEQEAREPNRGDLLEYFLSNVIWLVGHCSDIRTSLPSKAHDDRASEYPLYRGAREAVKIACALAERHAPAAVPKLKRLRNCAQSTFVSKLHRSRHRFPMISIQYRDIKPPS